MLPLLIRPLPALGRRTPEPEGVLVRLKCPSAIRIENGIVGVADGDLAGAIASLDAIQLRLVRDGAVGVRPLLYLRTGPGRVVTDALEALSMVPCVLRVEPNYMLGSDDASAPTDYYFQNDVWPYPPFTGPDDMIEYVQDWDHCVMTEEEHWPHPAKDDDVDLPDSWHLQMTQTNLAWLVEPGSKDVVVAIIDSGVDWRHPDLAPNMWNNAGEDVGGAPGTIISSDPFDDYALWQFDPVDLNQVNDDASAWDTEWIDDLVGWRFHGGAIGNPTWPGDPTLPMNDPNHGHCVEGAGTYGLAWSQNNEDWVDLNGYQNPHGTQMASIIGATHNGFGCVGVAPNVSLMAINAGKTIEVDPNAYNPNSHAIGIDEMVEALTYALVKGADIVNISLSYWLDDYPESLELLDAVNAALNHGLIICSSAGNEPGENNRWPAAIPGVLSCAAVRVDSVKASQSSFADHVAFCAPSGEQAYSAPFRGDEYMTAVKFAPPEPFWPDDVPDHQEGVPTGPIHTYANTDGHTSGCAAQLSGAFALLKAHYPSHSRQQLIDEMIRGSVNVDHLQDEAHQGKLGHGLINPYRALTEWGGPRSTELPDVTWSGDIWISGDYEVPEDGTLTIEPGTTVHVANFDNEHIGFDTIEIIADKIYAVGTALDSIRFMQYGPSTEDHTWLLRTRESSESVVQMEYCDFEGLWDFTASGSVTATDTSYIANCSFLDPAGTSVQVLRLRDIHLNSCIFGPQWTILPEDSVRIEWCKIEHDPTQDEFMPAIALYGTSGGHCFIENSIVRDAEDGIRITSAATDTLCLNNVLIEHAHEEGVQERGEIGIDIYSSRVQAHDLTLRGYTVGVSTRWTGKFDAEYSSFTDCYQAALNQDGDHVMFFGYYLEPGHELNKGGFNIFDDNEVFNIVNLHRTGTILARHNWWGSASGPPPKSNKGRIDVLHHLVVPPYLPPPPDFAIFANGSAPSFEVGQNFPNPFNPVTEFTLAIPAGGGLLRGHVYDIKGRRVRELANDRVGTGEIKIGFDGRDDAGQPLPSGMYLCRFNFRGREEIVKATLVK